MSSAISITNLALTTIGEENIASFTEDSEAARVADLLYPQSVKDLLKEHNWNFGQRRVFLASTTVPDGYDQYSFAYPYPSDCLQLDKIADELGNEYNYEVVTYLSAGVYSTLILTNLEQAVGFYTTNISDISKFDSLFQKALVHLLAYQFAWSLAKNLKLQEAQQIQYQRALSFAKTQDNKQRNLPKREDPWVTERTGVTYSDY